MELILPMLMIRQGAVPVATASCLNVITRVTGSVFDIALWL